MTAPLHHPLMHRPLMRRRMLGNLLAGAALGAGALVLPGCADYRRWSLVDAVRRLLELSARNAFARLTAPGGFWDDQLARLDLPDVFGRRGSVMQNILASPLFRERLQRELNIVAEDGARRAAPVVADAVEIIGIDNALDLLRGGPSAATAHLRAAMAGRLIDEMVPALGDALRVVDDPLLGQAISALAGVDVAGVARSLAREADDAIWGAIGREEAAIRADPQATRDPVLIAALKAV